MTAQPSKKDLIDFRVLDRITTFEADMRGIVGEDMDISLVIKQGGRMNIVSTEDNGEVLRLDLQSIAAKVRTDLRSRTETTFDDEPAT